MIVYVESNFILEIALEQEEASHALGILDLAEAGEAKLLIPSFAISEPFSAVMIRCNERAKLCDQLGLQLLDLGRSRPYRLDVFEFQKVPAALLAVERHETDRLIDVVGRILEVSETIDLTSISFAQAQDHANRYDLSPQDAIVYASVIHHLMGCDPAIPKCFLSRNFRDFGDPGIVAELKDLGCKYLPKFEDGLGYITSKIVG